MRINRKKEICIFAVVRCSRRWEECCSIRLMVDCGLRVIESLKRTPDNQKEDDDWPR